MTKQRETLEDKELNIQGLLFYSKLDVKKFIKFEKVRRENQLRIHWNWLKDKSYKEVVKFLNVMTDKRAGEGLVK